LLLKLAEHERLLSDTFKDAPKKLLEV